MLVAWFSMSARARLLFASGTVAAMIEAQIATKNVANNVSMSENARELFFLTILSFTSN